MFGVYNWFCMNALENPSKTALITEGGRVSYGELNGRINRLAYGMKSAGIRKGTRVGLLFPNGQTYIEALFAALKLGAFVVPFNTRFGAAEVTELVDAVGCEYMLYGKAFEGMVSDLECPGVLWYGEGELSSDYGKIADLYDNKMENWDFFEEMSAEDEVMAIFTGGTTGRSKAAVHTHQGLLMQVLPRVIDYTRTDVYLNFAPLFHVGGLSALMVTFATCNTFVSMERFIPEVIMRVIQEERVTQMFLIPPNICERFKASPEWGKYDLSSVRLVRVGGGAWNEKVIDDVFSVFPKAEIFNAYSCSEFIACVNITCSREMIKDNPKLTTALGKPSYYTEILVLDDDGKPVPCGVPGELWGKCPGMMKRYLGFNGSDRDGFMPTGDLVTVDEEGYVYFVSRKKDMIKCGGENIYAQEVEDVIKRHPAVANCGVVGLPDSSWGEIVAAAVVLRPGKTLTADELIEFCRRNMSSYKKPRKVFILDALPLTAKGTVKKSELKEILSAM